MDLISIFRFDDNGRLIEEFARTDYRSLLNQLVPRQATFAPLDGSCWEAERPALSRRRSKRGYRLLPLQL